MITMFIKSSNHSVITIKMLLELKLVFEKLDKKLSLLFVYGIGDQIGLKCQGGHSNSFRINLESCRAF